VTIKFNLSFKEIITATSANYCRLRAKSGNKKGQALRSLAFWGVEKMCNYI